MTKLLVALAFLGLNVYTYHWMANDSVIPPRDSFADFPNVLGEWRCLQREQLEEGVLANLGATDYLICNYTRGAGDFVSVYIGYHETQIREEGGGSGENSIHPPAHCLPGSGWDIVASRTVPLEIQGLPATNPEVKRLVIAKGQRRQLVYYWYQSRGRIIAEDWQKIVYVGLDRAARGRTDGSLVRFTVPVRRETGGEMGADAAFADLAPRVLAILSDFVPE